MWFWHFWGSVFCLLALLRPLADDSNQESVLFSVLIVPLWTGVITASLGRDFLTKPFTFCTPRHSGTWRRTLFTVALVVAGVCTLVTLISNAGTLSASAISVWLTFILCLAMFMVAVCLAVLLPNVAFLPALISVLLLIIMNDNLGEHIRLSSGGALLTNPVVTTAACAAILLAAWLGLGSRMFTRRQCGVAFLGPHSAFSRDKAAAYQAERKLSRMRRAPGALMRSLERFFIAQMRALVGRPTLKSLWGTLYVQTGKLAPARLFDFIMLSILLMTLTLVLGYYQPYRLASGVSGANLMLFLVCTINAEYRLNPHAGLLINISRKNRFRSLMFSALSQWLAAAVIAAAITILSVTAGRFLDEVTVYGGTYAYTPIQPMAFFIFAPMLPFYFLSQVLFPRYHTIALMVIATVGTIAFFAIGHMILGMPALGIFLLQAASWLPFVLFIHRYCYSWDLKLSGQ
jgi:hypothetical protein